MMSNEQPLILVVYMDRRVMYDQESMAIISDAMKKSLDDKGAHALTYFVPTDGQERIECINPVLATEEQVQKIDKLIMDIENAFDIKHNLLEQEEDFDDEDFGGSAVKPFKTDES